MFKFLGLGRGCVRWRLVCFCFGGIAMVFGLAFCSLGSCLGHAVLAIWQKPFRDLPILVSVCVTKVVITDRSLRATKIKS